MQSQFLDTGKMTDWGKTRDANFWIENASVAWNEAQAPFHTVARLTLLGNSHLSSEASEATYFDVTGNSTPDSGCGEHQSRPLSRRSRQQQSASHALIRLVPYSDFERKKSRSSSHCVERSYIRLNCCLRFTHPRMPARNTRRGVTTIGYICTAWSLTLTTTSDVGNVAMSNPPDALARNVC